MLIRSTLAQRRPIEQRETMQAMLDHADIIFTARKQGFLVGVSRALTDFAYCTYLADLAVDQQLQRQGIGKELIRRTQEAAGLGTNLILLAAPTAATYYPHVGLIKHDSCWVLPRNS